MSARGLSKPFLDDLKSGCLSPLLERVKADKSLCLEIRDKYINIYYRGGNLLKVSATKGAAYTCSFDTKYATLGAKTKADKKTAAAKFGKKLPGRKLKRKKDVKRWLKAFPKLKLAMDLFLGAHPKEEREAQQLMVRDNNFGGVSRATDYYICDIEYANKDGRFDLIAVHWPSTSSERQKKSDRRLVFVEVKYGDGAVSGKSGLKSHVQDINDFVTTGTNLQKIKDEMVTVFEQKQQLELIECKHPFISFSDEKPVLLLVLINHDPDSTKLRTALKSLPASPHLELQLATGSLMGYGLFDPAIEPLATAQKSFAACI